MTKRALRLLIVFGSFGLGAEIESRQSCGNCRLRRPVVTIVAIVAIVTVRGPAAGASFDAIGISGHDPVCERIGCRSQGQTRERSER
ncbi:MAG: hypothetical protein EA381_02320 [Planctomycetaceae bacterium]|nr:MAG: hypothetical protein EA381_02320 [Planctomycetaceae bacterium]